MVNIFVINSNPKTTTDTYLSNYALPVVDDDDGDGDDDVDDDCK